MSSNFEVALLTQQTYYLSIEENRNGPEPASGFERNYEQIDSIY